MWWRGSAVRQALLGFTSERRWLRHAREHLGAMFPALSGQPGYNKAPARSDRHDAGRPDPPVRHHRPWDDDARVANSAPIECARSRQTVKRSDLVGWAEYG